MAEQPQRQMVQIEAHQFQGPIPPPAALAEYDRIHAGLADRIVAMAEKQMMHRQELERVVVTGESKRANRGQWFALIIGIAGLGVAGFAVALNQQVAAAIIGGLDLAGLVGTFLYGTAKKREHLDQRARTPVEIKNS